jgi:hypothetical protein
MTKTCNQAIGAPHGIATILVDGTLMTSNKHFAKAEERIHSNSDIGQTQTITNGSQIKLGGVQIGRDGICKRLSIEVDVVHEAYAKFELANLGFERTAYNLADPITNHVKNTHLGKLLDTGVVDHPVEEYVTRAQMTHDAPFDEADTRPSTYLSSLAPCAETRKGFMTSTIHGSSVHVMVLCFVLCTCHGFVFCDVQCHGFVFCAVYKALSMSKLCALCFGTRHGPA